MKKLLLLSIALLSVLFLTFTSCKKKDTTPMSGTTWTTTDNGSTMTLSFDGSGKGATFTSTGTLVFTINGTYEYSSSEQSGLLSGTYKEQPVALFFGVDNNTLTLEISEIVGNYQEITFTKK